MTRSLLLWDYGSLHGGPPRFSVELRPSDRSQRKRATERDSQGRVRQRRTLVTAGDEAVQRTRIRAVGVPSVAVTRPCGRGGQAVRGEC